MKSYKNSLKITLGILLISSAMAFANNNDPINKENEKDKTEMSSSESPMELNEEYLTVVHENASQEEVKFLSGIVAKWDVRNSSKFQAKNEPFKTVFKSNKGFAEVTYDSQGRVSQVEKRLSNVVLPSQITKVVYKRYQDWTIVENKLSLSYKEGSVEKKTYEVTIMNGNKKKRIRVNA